MNIAKDCVVSFHYRLSDESGTPIEDSHAGDPTLYLHGHGGIIPGLEQAMAGRAPGDAFAATIPPEAAYGPRHGGATQRVPMKHVLTRGKLRTGQMIAINSEDGPRQVTVVKAGKFVVDVDTHHPLAGRTLTFSIDIVDVRHATAEELAHGHAHGPGGHHQH
ncbi:MAG: peptidylprolyl isomerase [Gammaproteobacteria bacterium]